MQKKQFNVRIPSELLTSVLEVCKTTGLRRDDFGDVAFATLLGSKNRIMAAKRQIIRDVAKQLELSFDCADGQHVSLTA